MRGLSATRGAQLIRHLAVALAPRGRGGAGCTLGPGAWGSAVRAGHFGLALHIHNAWTERHAWRPAHPPPRAWHLHRGDVAVRAAHSGLGPGGRQCGLDTSASALHIHNAWTERYAWRPAHPPPRAWHLHRVTSRCGLHTRAWGSAVRAGHFGLSLHIQNAWTERYAWRPAHLPPRAWHLHRGDVAVRAAHSGLGARQCGLDTSASALHIHNAYSALRVAPSSSATSRVALAPRGRRRCGLHTRAWAWGSAVRAGHFGLSIAHSDAWTERHAWRQAASATSRVALAPRGRRGAGCTLGPGALGLGSAGWTLRPQHCTLTMRGLSATRGAQLIRHLARGTCTAGTSRCGLHTRAWGLGLGSAGWTLGLSIAHSQCVD